MAATTCLGIDLGASSGRVMAGWLDSDGLMRLDEVRRFVNEPVNRDGLLCWDFDGLMAEILAGIGEGIAKSRAAGRPVVSIGIDSWGVDFGLLDERRQLTGPIVHYRDSRTDGQMEKVFQKISREEIFEETGIQFLPFNTIYQLAALKEIDPEQLERARHFMMIADLVAWKLTGQVSCEFTNATTTQLFNARVGKWSEKLLSALDLPSHIFQKPLQPGTAIGELLPELSDRWGAGVQVVAVATHDTGSAVAAVPAEIKTFAYLSCGTWSLLGTELLAPIINDKSSAENFTNEGGVNGTTRFLKNIMGLWILQECQRQWKREGRGYDWPMIQQMAEEAADNATIIDVDDNLFLPPGNMPQRIKDWARQRKLPVPEADGAVAASVLKSLAQRYAKVLSITEELCGENFSALHAVGGGIQNRLLLKWTAEAIGKPVVAGPAEATVAGNIGLQMIQLGQLGDLASMRSCIKRSFPPAII